MWGLRVVSASTGTCKGWCVRTGVGPKVTFPLIKHLVLPSFDSALIHWEGYRYSKERMGIKGRLASNKVRGT